MRLIDADRKPKIKYYVWAQPIGDNHFPGMTKPDYVVDDKYFDTIEEAEKLKAECDNNGMWENYYIHKKVEPFEEYPTVEAIPIEWVENFIKQLSDIVDGFDKASLSYLLSNVKLNTLKDMLKDWEKENE